MNKPFANLLYLSPILMMLSYLALPIFKETPQVIKTPEQPQPLVEDVALSTLPCNCTLTQGSFTTPVPLLSAGMPAVNFYSYGNPIGASANTGAEMSETMLIMMYEDLTSGDISLIFILDEANDGTGGNMDLTVSCLPNSANVTLSDDGGELSGSGPVISGAFNWSDCCTDGGVIGGVGCSSTFIINPASYSGITDFALAFGAPGAYSYISIPVNTCPMTINCGGTACCDEAFEISATYQNATCEDSGDGAIDLTTDCATIPTFQWSNGAATEDLFDILPGAYSVTITDANGCSQTDSYVIDSDSPSPEPTITGPTEFCTGENAELNLDDLYSTYQWSNGSTDPYIIVSSPGPYSVTVTNAAGCSGTASTTLTENPAPMPDITGPNSICANDTVSLDAGPGFSLYEWSNNENTQITEVSQFGGYSVTVTNSFGCTAFDVKVLDPIPSPTPMITGPNSICSGNPVTLNAGTGFESYQWSTGATSQTIATTEGGTFSVTVTNDEGCDGADTLEIVENQADSILLFQTSCNPADTGVFVSQYVNQAGCDSLEILTVSFSESDSVFLYNQSCNAQDTGIFIQTFVNQYGCDSVEIETVTLLPTDSFYIEDFSCSPLDTGMVVQSLTNQFGCDSIVTTSTALLLSDTLLIFENSCDPANAGVTEELFINQNGCDSLVITTTGFSLVDTTYLFDTSCNPMLTGVFEDLYMGSDGCDSLVINTIDLLLSDTTYLEVTTCDVSQAGQSEELLLNGEGCDSLVITNSFYTPPDTTLIFLESCDPNGTGVFEDVLTNGFSCDSLLITTVSLLPSDTTAFLQTSCDPNQAGTEEVLLTNQSGCDSLLVITTIYAEADSIQINTTTCDPAGEGVFVEILTSTDGCDSVVTTTITLLPSDTVQVFTQTCDPMNVGTFEELLVNQFGCDSLVVTTTALLPSDTTLLSATTCDINQTGQSGAILPNQYGCDSLLITNTTFIPPDTTLFFAESCDPDLVGTEVVVLQNLSGCDSSIITTTALLPSDTTEIQAFSCDPGQVGITEELLANAFGCDSLIITQTVQWPVDTTWLAFESCSPMDTGLVFTVLSNQYGCDSLIFEQTNLLPASDCQLNALIQGDTIGCLEPSGSLWLTFFDGVAPYQYTWTDQNGNTGSGFVDQGGQPQQVAGLPPGTYTFEILDIDGLMTTLSGVIFQPSPLQLNLQVASNFNGYGISCFGGSDGSASATVLSGGLPAYSYVWSNGSQTGQTSGLGSGLATVTVTDAVGCTAIGSILLESPGILQFSFSTTHPDCLTEGQGAIAIDQVLGGVGPYEYALNQNVAQADPVFEDLGPGTYLIEVEDANECAVSASTSINPFTQLTVYLGQDETIEYGDSIVLQPTTSVPVFLLDSILWGGVDCPGCPNVIVGPTTASSFSVTVIDSLGCRASDELQVFVEKNFHVYIPNAFSPDANGINDIFTIYGGAHLVTIRELQIFDRWGEPVFTGFNLPPNDPRFGWDGTYRGEPLGPSVFAFFAVLEFVDSSTKLVKGDVTLMR